MHLSQQQERATATTDANPKTTVAAQVAALPSTPMAELWTLWDRTLSKATRPPQPPATWNPALAYRIQELAYGALAQATIRRMLVEAGAKHCEDQDSRRPQRADAVDARHHADPRVGGARVPRHGDARWPVCAQRTRRSRALSAAARHITGTRWNWPNFFGLRDGKADAR
jgi:hypothetical protein